jgi:hypothetical protein
MRVPSARAPGRSARRLAAHAMAVAALTCAAPMAALAQGTASTAPLRVLCLHDAATAAPVQDAIVRLGTDERATRRASGTRRETSSAARATIARAELGCVALRVADGELVQVQRMGYLPSRTSWPVAQDSISIALQPVAALLSASVVRAAAVSMPQGSALATSDARAFGASTSGALVALLPYTQPRSARGEVSVSLRGARREQVAVTLDGLPLTDPATGIADLADVPLAVLGGATVAPGSDPLGTGPGAVGGVLALHTGDGTVTSVRAGAFGAVTVEGAHALDVAGGRLRLGASRQVARNDFAFRNDATTTGVSVLERRVNNDVTRHALFAQWRGRRVQLSMLGSQADLGLVGPVNVRAADEDRSRTARLFVRASVQHGGTLVSSGVRAFGLAYRDPTRPTFDTDADAVAADVEVRRLLHGVLLHGGVGGDRLRTSARVAQDRTRAFSALSRTQEWLGLDWLAGARLDAVRGNGVLPSFSVSGERRSARGSVGARAAQAVRVPTLYDLYFSSPQRLTVPALRAERVVLDAELFARWRSNAEHAWRLALDAALVARTSRDAIVWFPGNFGWSPANVGTETLRGLEMRGAWDRHRTHVSVWGTWHRAQLTSGALRIPTPYVPVQAAGAIARAPLGPVEIGAAARWLGPRPFTAGPRDPAFTLPGVSLLDLSLSTRRHMRGAPLLLTAALDNATDRAWQSVRGFPSPGRAWSVAITLLP